MAANEKSKPPPPYLSPRQTSTTKIDATTPISYLYLTFDVEPPNPQIPEQFESRTGNERALPPAPNLRPYISPSKWSFIRKNVTLILSCLATFHTSFAAGAYSPPVSLMAKDFGASHLVLVLGISSFCWGFAIAPMVLAPLSEIWGRKPIFVISGIIFLIFQALSSIMPDAAGMVICRFFGGIGASVFSAVVGGVLADIYEAHERNAPMALFAAAALVGIGAGPLSSAALIESLGPTTLAWKWSFWVQAIMDGGMVLALIFLFSESRRSVILAKKAKALNSWYEELEKRGVYGFLVSRELAMTAFPSSSCSAVSLVPGNDDKDSNSDNDNKSSRPFDDEKKVAPPSQARLRRIRWVVKEDEQRASVGQIIATSLKRPFHLLITEPVVSSFSLWAAFSWGVLFLSFSVVPFLYGSNFDLSARVYVAIMIAATIATFVSIGLDSLLRHPQWRRHDDNEDFQYSDSKFWAMLRESFPAEAPESRLYFSCFTSILLPVGLFLALLSDSQHGGYKQAVGFGLAIWGIYSIYLSTFNYLADSYHIYASSALATQSFCRNIIGGSFPLVTNVMFKNLGTKGAGGLLGGIAVLLTVIPWVLLFFGEKIRSKSKVALSLNKS